MTKNRILIVDDDVTNIKVLKHILEGDYDLVEAHTGEDALEKINQSFFDLILLDVMMPKMNGYEVCRCLKGNDKTQFTKVILVSAKAMINERLEGYQVGADDYITKPFDDQELLAKVKVFLKLKSMQEINQMKTYLLTLLSHEIRTPLNIILGFSEIVSQSNNLSDIEKNHLKRVLEAGNTLLSLAQKSLLFCEVKAGVKLSIQDVPIERLVRKIINQLDEKANAAKVSFILQSKIEKSVKVDTFYINHAITFVLENAIKFSPQGKTINVLVEEQNGMCSVIVDDEGVGINKDDAGRIFEAFSSVNLEKNQHQSGSGLSLAIAKNILQLHEGDVIATNSPKGGARFVISWPVSIGSKESLASSSLN